MRYDAVVPKQLKRTQQWFASIITSPIDEDSHMNPVSPTGRPMVEEACDYISPSPTLRAHERIQIYNQQYWWRLLTALHESCPLVTRLFGYTDFNRTIAIPYLVKYPSNHWSLSYIGNRLAQWIEEEYTADDKPLIYHAAMLDWAYNDSFIAPQGKEISANDMTQLLVTKLYLQPHIHLFALPYDLFEFRFEFLKHEPDYWLEHDFPELKHFPKGELAHTVLYRNRQHNITFHKISANEYQVLRRFASGTTVEAICEWLEQQPSDSSLCVEAGQNLHLWFQHWTSRHWLAQG